MANSIRDFLEQGMSPGAMREMAASGGIGKMQRAMTAAIPAPGVFQQTDPVTGAWQQGYEQNQQAQQAALEKYAQDRQNFRNQSRWEAQQAYDVKNQPAPQTNNNPGWLPGQGPVVTPGVTDQVAQTIPTQPEVSAPTTPTQTPTPPPEQPLPLGQPRSLAGVQQPQPGRPWWQQPLTQETTQPAINALRGSSDINSPFA